MVEAKKNERANALKEVRRLCKEFGFTAGMLKGSLDVNVPLSNGQILTESIPNVSSNFIDGEGHFSILINHGEKMLTELIG